MTKQKQKPWRPYRRLQSAVRIERDDPMGLSVDDLPTEPKKPQAEGSEDRK